MFDHLPTMNDHWDGHTTEEKYERLAEIEQCEVVWVDRSH